MDLEEVKIGHGKFCDINRHGCRTCWLIAEVERLKAENEQLKERLEDVYLKDTGKTREINILTKEYNKLRKALEKIREHYTLDSFAGVASQEALR